MAINKVLDEQDNVLLDLTGDDVSEDTSKVLEGYKYHGRDGIQYVGTASSGGVSGSLKTFRVPQGETIEKGDFVNVESYFGNSNFQSIDATNYVVCDLPDGSVVIMSYGKDGKNYIQHIGFNQDTQQTVFSEPIDLGSISSSCDIVYLQNNDFIIAYPSSGVKLRKLTVDFDTNEFTLGEPVQAVTIDNNWYALSPKIKYIDSSTLALTYIYYYTQYPYTKNICGVLISTQSLQKKGSISSLNLYNNTGDCYIRNILRLNENDFIAVCSTGASRTSESAYLVVIRGDSSSISFPKYRPMQNVVPYFGIDRLSDTELIVFGDMAGYTSTNAEMYKRRALIVHISEDYTFTEDNIVDIDSSAIEGYFDSNVSIKTINDKIAYASCRARRKVSSSYEDSYFLYKLTRTDSGITWEKKYQGTGSSVYSGKLIRTSDNSFAWFYCNGTGNIQQKTIDYQDIPTTNIGNAFVTNKVSSGSRYIGVASETKTGPSTIKISVPY